MPKRILFKVRETVFSDAAGRDTFLNDAFVLLRLPPTAAAVRIIPVFRDPRLNPARLAELEKEAVLNAQNQHKVYKPPRFLSYFYLEVPDNVDADMVLQRLRSIDVSNVVEFAYEQPKGREPVDPEGNPDFKNQGYLKNGGINIASSWPRPGGKGKPGLDGSGIKFADVERSWDRNHPDLMNEGALRVELRYGDEHPNGVIRDHGTAVVGIVAAMDNGQDIVGIAPNVDRVMAYSWHKFSGDEEPYEALAVAESELAPGDVLLIERCSVGSLNGNLQALPQETDPLAWEIILNATTRGVIVVEPAGNDSKDIDDFVFENGDTFATRNSEAIIVGASLANLSRTAVSNFGNRVDCFALGDGVFTLADRAFGGTSAASAIIAGAAVAVQGFAKTVLGGVLTAEKLRGLFRDATFNTLSVSGINSDKIGVMPNIKAIIRHLEGS